MVLTAERCLLFYGSVVQMNTDPRRKNEDFATKSPRFKSQLDHLPP